MTDSHNQPNINLATADLSNTAFPFVVGPPGSGARFNRVQEAIDAAGERTIDDVANVIILGGRYEEEVRMRRAVTLLGVGGAQLVGGGLIIDLEPTPGGAIDDTVTAIQNLIFDPDPGVDGIRFEGSNPQIAVLNNIQLTANGGNCLNISNTGVGATQPSALIGFGCQFNQDDGTGLVLSHTEGGALFAATEFSQADNADRAILYNGAFQLMRFCSIDGDVRIDGGSFAGHFFNSYGSDMQAVIDNDGFLFLAQAALQTDATPAIITSGATGVVIYTDIAYLGGGRGFGPGYTIGVNLLATGQAYTPSAAAAGSYAGSPPTSLEEALDRIAAAGGVPPY